MGTVQDFLKHQWEKIKGRQDLSVLDSLGLVWQNSDLQIRRGLCAFRAIRVFGPA